ncbi:MAG: radical SAM protein [Promethearchaeota archaeon]
MRVTLVHPNLHGEYSPSLGVTYVGTVLQRHGHEVKVLDFTGMKRHWMELLHRHVRSFQPEVVGFSVLSFNVRDALVMSVELKRVDPEVVTLFGGVHATLAPGELLERPEVDAACTGEGEETVPKFLEALGGGGATSLPDVAGVWYKKKLEGRGNRGTSRTRENRGEEVVRNPPRPVVADLDALPFPNWDLWDNFDRYLDFMQFEGELPVLASRGCPYSCSFCSNHRLRRLMPGPPVRVRSPANVVEEVGYQLEKYGDRVKVAYFWDENFFGNRREAFEEFCRLYVAAGLHERVRWSCNVRADAIDRDWAETARRAGCFHVRFGVESGNEVVRNAVLNKGLSDEVVFRARRVLREADLLCRANFILGAPGETVETMRQTLRFVRELDPDFYFLSVFQPLPGTRVLDLVERLGGRIEVDKWQSSTNFWSTASVDTKYLRARDVERFRRRAYLRGALEFLLRGLREHPLRFWLDALHFFREYYLKRGAYLLKLATFTVGRYEVAKWLARSQGQIS